MISLECTVYDLDGNAIDAPKDHVLISSREGQFWAPYENRCVAEFVYRPDRLNPEISKDSVKDAWVLDFRECDSQDNANI